MTATSHALTGAAIASFIREPYLALPLAFLSHFICDSLPHFGINMKFGSKAMYRWLLFDGLAAISFAVLLIVLGVNNHLLLALAAFVAMSPDFAWLYYGLKDRYKSEYRIDFATRFHEIIQWYQKPQGIYVEIVWVVIMCSIIIKLS